jgi:hypothetical protein
VICRVWLDAQPPITRISKQGASRRAEILPELFKTLRQQQNQLLVGEPLESANRKIHR